MIAFTSSVPRRDVLTGKAGLLSAVWDRWFSRLEAWWATVPGIIGKVALNTQGAAIGATAVPATLKGGLYRVSTYIRLTRAATTSSSVTLTIAWTDNGVACSRVGTALVGNTTATLEALCFPVRCDAGTSITFAVAYASVGATSARFGLDVRVEELT